MIREIVTIDEELCDGCGLCIPACQEGALRLVNGKARLVADRVCDGLGACLGHCPRGAIKIERREAEAFDEAAVAALAGEGASPDSPTEHTGAPAVAPHGDPPLECGCPGTRLIAFDRPDQSDAAAAADTPASSATRPSELTHWPVQLRLLPLHAPMLREARLLVAADCVPVACPDFHDKLLRGRTVVIGCPKFDDLPGYVEKLTEMIRVNRLREIVVARMEVPCCTGIAYAVTEARRRAGVDVPVTEVIIGTRGEILASRELPCDAVA
jgi:NAD-dependent dihydropyrimidine dehydrogenase PreA subunit